MSVAIRYYIFTTIVLGILYPYLITGIAQTLFYKKANGSLIISNGAAIGSELIAQKFEKLEYFYSRPSSTNYKVIPSGASQLGPISQKLKENIEKEKRIVNQNMIPDDLLTSSASGLDPHLTPEAVYSQAPRVALARNLTEEESNKLDEIIKESIEERTFGILGNRRINILKLNLKIDKIFTLK